MVKQALVFALALAASLGVRAQYPAQPIKLISPFPPGGSVDIMARLIADPLAEKLGGRIVIENRSGASGNIGMEAAARAPAAGYTLGIKTIPLRPHASLFQQLPWGALPRFAPIG